MSFINVSPFKIIFEEEKIGVLKHAIHHLHGEVPQVPLLDVHLGGGVGIQNIYISKYNTYYPTYQKIRSRKLKTD